MKNFIYTTLLVFASLFCQAFGAQNEPLQILDTICVNKGDCFCLTPAQHTELVNELNRREQALWLPSNGNVKIAIQRCWMTTEEMQGEIQENTKMVLPCIQIEKSGLVYVKMRYRRTLICNSIPRNAQSAQSSVFAMWHFFGKLLSETDKDLTVVSDKITVETVHEATFIYRVELNMPDKPLKIVGDTCFDGNGNISLSVDPIYALYPLKWTVNGKEEKGNDTKTGITIEDNSGRYINTIECTVKACKGQERSDSIKVGKPTPAVQIADFDSCWPLNSPSFSVRVKEANPQLTYHWALENPKTGDILEEDTGAVFTMRTMENLEGTIKLIATGGCRSSESTTSTIYRSLAFQTNKLELKENTDCLFMGDTLHVTVTNVPDGELIWKMGSRRDTIQNLFRIYVPKSERIGVSVYVPGCPDYLIADTFNIREDLKVSIEPNEGCISAHTDYVFRVSGNGINPEVHWCGNGVEIDSSMYKKEDSIRLKLTNPGGENLYVAFTVKECGRECQDSLVLRPKPEMPSLDTLWNVLTPCIPLGIADTIELRVQPQEGVKFRWSILEEEITELDSNSIHVRVNYDLAERNAPIPVSVYAYTIGCPNNSETLQDTLYAIGAGLGEEWDVIQQLDEEDGEIYGYYIGFSDDGLFVKDYGLIDPFYGRYLFDWYGGDFKFGNNTFCSEYFMIEDVDEPFDIFCKLTCKESLCYSVYSTIVGDVDMFKSQSVVPELRLDAKTGERNDSESTQRKRLQENKDTPCPGIVLKPNPIRSGVQVKVEGICETESFTVECYSPQGRLMFRTTAKGDTFTLPTDNYAAGVYIIKIQLDGAAEPVVKKMIIL